MSLPVHLAIIAHDPIVRDGLDFILSAAGFVIVAKATTGAALVRAMKDHRAPDVVLLDCHVADESIEDCRRVRHALPAVRIVLMADDCSIDAIARAFGAGIDGYLARNIACESLASALRLVSLGEQVIPSATVDSLTHRPMRSPQNALAVNRLAASLTGREIEILRGVARGEGNKAIAGDLGITETTVKSHINTILNKLGLMNRTQAAMWTIANGLPNNDSTPIE